MFARVFAVASLAALAVANPLAVRGGESKCNNGQIQCCQQTQQVTYSCNLIYLFAYFIIGLFFPVWLQQQRLGFRRRLG